MTPGEFENMMDVVGRVPGRVIPPNGEGTWMQKHYAKAAFLMTCMVGVAGGAYIGFVLDPQDALLMTTGICMMVLFPIMGLFTGLLIASTLQRPLWPVMLYEDGAEFHQFAFDRLIRRKAFVPLSDLVQVRVVRFTNVPSLGAKPRDPVMSFLTTKKASYWIGQRTEHDTQQALEYIRKEWPTVQVTDETISSVNGRRVNVPAPTSSGPGKARKVAVRSTEMPVPPGAYEPRPDQTPAAPVPAASFCPSCGAGVASGARFCPDCGRRFGPSVLPGGAVVGESKSAQLALVLSLVPGLGGILGVGHFYVRQYAKGVLLLVLGLFSSVMGLGSLLLLSDPAYAGSTTYLVTALLFNLLFLMLLIYSVIDARKGVQKLNAGTH